jgi:glycosyltransferase involved in cell wall biosynthesis
VRPKVAFVVQRCGAEVNGGAEYACLAIAQRLSERWDIEIVTTCALDYQTWSNHYPPGVERLGSVGIRRFPVDQPRDPKVFDALSERIVSLSKVTAEEQDAWMRAQGPYSTALLDYVAACGAHFDAWFFFTYLYATTYFALPLVADRAFLVPFAHDEWPIHLQMWDGFFARPKAVVFSTEEERAFLAGRFPGKLSDGPTIGIGIDPDRSVDVAAFQSKFELCDPFLLYVGRVDVAKGCDRLFADFIAMKRRSPGPLRLVLIGRASMEIPYDPDIVALGYIPEVEKWSALTAARALVMPSSFESLSIVLLESWSTRRPVIVNGDNPVLVGQCRRANGGLTYRSAVEFRLAAEALEGAFGDVIGTAGSRFVEKRYAWPRVVEAYDALLTAPRHPEAPVVIA